MLEAVDENKPTVKDLSEYDTFTTDYGQDGA